MYVATPYFTHPLFLIQNIVSIIDIKDRAMHCSEISTQNSFVSIYNSHQLVKFKFGGSKQQGIHGKVQYVARSHSYL